MGKFTGVGNTVKPSPCLRRRRSLFQASSIAPYPLSAWNASVTQSSRVHFSVRAQPLPTVRSW